MRVERRFQRAFSKSNEHKLVTMRKAFSFYSPPIGFIIFKSKSKSWELGVRLKVLDNSMMPLVQSSQSRKSSVPFKAVYALVDLITALPDRDAPPASDHNFCIVQSLAEENGFRVLRTPEEFAISAAMKDLKVGPRTAHYGWRLYKRYRTTGTFDAGAINY